MSDYRSPEFRRFVTEHAGDDVSRLRLKYHGSEDGFDYPAAILQIECRRKYARKFDETLSADPYFFFPDNLSCEQSTSDLLAAFHATLVEDGKYVTDFTSGLGIDCLHIARHARTVTAVERRRELCEALRFNAETLGLKNLRVVEGDCRTLLAEGYLGGDVAFIDPARRSADGGRVFAISDCEPDVLAMLSDIMAHFDVLIIKLSPMLDIARTIADLPGIKDLYTVGTSRECKEVVAVVGKHTDGEPMIHAVTIAGDGSYSSFDLTRSEESAAPAPALCDPEAGGYLYEPLPVLMKAAPFRLVAARYGLNKLHNNTHIYYSPLAKDCPGMERKEIVEVIPWQSKNIKRLKSRYPNIDVAVRNFGMSADALRAKLGVGSGSGSTRLLAVTASQGQKLMLILK